MDGKNDRAEMSRPRTPDRFDASCLALAALTETKMHARIPRCLDWLAVACLSMLIAVASTLVTYTPIFAADVGATSDGQRAAYFETFSLWSHWFAGGWPAYADPTSMAFYPPKYFSQWLGLGLDGFIALAFVVAGTGSGLLAFATTRDRLAALFAASVTPALGFFGAHISHTSMIHAVAWAPFMMLAGWGLSRASGSKAAWAGLLGSSLGLSLLAGHPQLTVYALVATMVLAVPRHVERGKDWIQAGLWGALGTAIGVGIALPQLMPSVEFASFSGRAVMDGEFLSLFSASAGSMLLNVFPFILGGNWANGNETVYLGPGSWNEVVAAMGVALLALSAIGASRETQKAEWWKFCAIGIGAAVLSVLPSWQFAANFLVNVPVLGDFRAWARWLSVSSLCLVQMAAIGIATLRSDEPVGARPWLKSLVLVLVAGWLAAIMLAKKETGTSPIAVFLTTPTVVQLVLGVACLLAISLALRPQKGAIQSAGLALCFLLPTAELAHLSRSMAWASNLMPTNGASGRGDIAAVRSLIGDEGRFLSMSGWQSRHLNADESRLHRIPSLNWYGPLLDQRFAQLSGLTSGGWTRAEALSGANQALDIYGVSVVETYTDFVRDKSGSAMPPITPDGVRLGPGCSESNPLEFTLNLATDLQVSRANFYTSLACSLDVKQGEKVATISAGEGDPGSPQINVVAGNNTAEWSHACIAARPVHMHGDPGAAAMVPLGDPAMACAGSVYLSTLPSEPSSVDLSSLKITYVAPSGGLIIHGASLEISGQQYPVGPGLMNALAGDRWTIRGITDGGGFLLSNARALPRFRFVDGVVRLDDQEALTAIRESRLPDGSLFDARTTAILESPGAVPDATPLSSDDAIQVETAGTASFTVSFPRRSKPTLLVFGDNYNRNWQATALGKPLEVMRTNYNQMSVMVPVSSSQVRFEYVDPWVRNGMIAATTSFILGLILMIGAVLRLGRRKKETLS